MIDKDFQKTIAIMCFAMVSIVVGSWVAHAVKVPKLPCPPSLRAVNHPQGTVSPTLQDPQFRAILIT